MSRSRRRRPRIVPRMPPRSRVRRYRRASRRWAAATVQVPALRLQPLTLMPTLDRRTWHPLGRSRPLTIAVDPPGGDRDAARRVARRAPWSFTRSHDVFADPMKVSVCVRRETRKRVMHALGKAGGRVRPPKRNEFSEISCRRK